MRLGDATHYGTVLTAFADPNGLVYILSYGNEGRVAFRFRYQITAVASPWVETE
jgi:hypothetical protein